MRISCPLVKTHNICPKCGAERDIWREVFAEEHYCPDNEKQVDEPKRGNEAGEARSYDLA